MNSVISKTFIGILLLLIVAGFAAFFSGALGDTRLGITLKTNESLENGLVGHFTFDGDFETGVFEFGSGGATATDPTSSFDGSRAMATDESGYVYVAGYCLGCGLQGSYAYYVYKVDPLSGSMIWSTTTDTGSGADIAFAITTDQLGYIYTTGYCTSCGSFGSNAHYTYKADAEDGSMIWSTTTDLTSGVDTARSITTDNAGYVYVAGDCTGCGSNGSNASYVYKIDPSDGAMLWGTTTDPGPLSDVLYGITTDDAGDVYVTGACEGCGNQGSNAHYTYKIDSTNGDMIWATTTDPTSTADFAYAIATDDDGFLYVAGDCFGCGSQGAQAHYLYKINPNDGSMLWSTTTDVTSSTETAYSVTTDSEGFLYVTGDCNGCGSFGSSAHYTYKVDQSDGSMLWATTTDPSGAVDISYAITSDSSGYVYVTGECDGCGSLGSNTHYTYKVDPSDGTMISTTTPGAIRNVGSRIVPGNVGQGVKTDGIDDYVRIDADNELRLSGESAVSFGAWVRSQDFDDAATGDTVFEVHSGSDDPYGLYFKDTGSPGLLGFYAKLDTTGGLIDNRQVHAFAPVEKHWYHIFVTWNAGMLHAYLDGELASTTASFGGGTIETNHTSDEEDLFVGLLESVGSGLFHSNLTIDDIRIYNRELSAEEVKRIHDLGATTKVNKTLTTNPDLEDGLVLHYTFDANDLDLSSTTAEIVDRSPEREDGDWQNHSTTSQPGAIGQGLMIDGMNDVIDVADGYTTHFANDFTVATWFYDSTTSTGCCNGIMGTWDGSDGDRVAMQFYHNSDPDDFRFRAGDTQLKYNLDGDFNKNAWNHYVGVRQGTAQIIYINGVEVERDNNAPAGPLVLTNNDYLRIGASSGGARGTVDDFRIYNRALATSTIQRIYELGATTKVNKTIDTNPDIERGLLNHYTFDGAESYNDFLDKSGNDWHAHLDRDGGEFMSTTTRPGKLGQGVYLDGENVSLFNATTTANLTNATYCFWMNLESLTNTDSDTRLYLLNKGIEFSINNSGQIRLWRATSGTYPQIFSGQAILTDEWYHICGIFETVGIRPILYVNGVDDSSGGDVGSGVTNDDGNEDLRFGSGGASIYEGNPRGIFDDIRVYNRILSAEEIARLYELGN